MIDPTWRTLGLCENGKIIVFYSSNEVKIFDIKEFASFVDMKNCKSFETLVEGSQYYIKSFEKPKLTLEEIKNKYGVQAQKVALNEVKEKEIKVNTERDVFVSSVRVNQSTINNFKNLETELNYGEYYKEENIKDNDYTYK